MQTQELMPAQVNDYGRKQQPVNCTSSDPPQQTAHASEVEQCSHSRNTTTACHASTAELMHACMPARNLHLHKQFW